MVDTSKKVTKSLSNRMNPSKVKPDARNIRDKINTKSRKSKISMAKYLANHKKEKVKRLAEDKGITLDEAKQIIERETKQAAKARKLLKSKKSKTKQIQERKLLEKKREEEFKKYRKGKYAGGKPYQGGAPGLGKRK